MSISKSILIAGGVILASLLAAPASFSASPGAEAGQAGAPAEKIGPKLDGTDLYLNSATGEIVHVTQQGEISPVTVPELRDLASELQTRNPGRFHGGRGHGFPGRGYPYPGFYPYPYYNQYCYDPMFDPALCPY